MTDQDLLVTLREYTPFDSIDEDLLKSLAESIEIKLGRTGMTLFEAGDYDPDEIYLVSGQVKLIAKDGRETIVDRSQANSHFPIARLRPRMYTAKASSDIRYFIVSKSVLDELQRSLQGGSSLGMLDDVRERAGHDGEALLYEFKQELDKGRFVLPSLPEVAIKIHEMIEDPDCSLADVAQLVNTDPAIAAKILKTANSVIYRRAAPYTDTQAAISRLGLITTKQLVTSYAVLGLFRANSEITKVHMRRIWQQSIEAAAFSYVIAKSLPTLDEGEAMLAGLLHNIGELVVITYAERFYDLSNDEQQLNAISMLLRSTIGEMVLEKWNFSPELITVARESGDWLRQTQDDFDYCDLVQVASLYAFQHHDDIELPELQSVPAIAKLAITQQQTSDIIEQAEDQIAEIRSLFSQAIS